MQIIFASFFYESLCNTLDTDYANDILGWRVYKQSKLQVPLRNLYRLIKRESTETLLSLCKYLSPYISQIWQIEPKATFIVWSSHILLWRHFFLVLGMTRQAARDLFFRTRIPAPVWWSSGHCLMTLSTGRAHCHISEVNHLHLISSLFFFFFPYFENSKRLIEDSTYNVCQALWFQSSAVFVIWLDKRSKDSFRSRESVIFHVFMMFWNGGGDCSPKISINK